MVKKKLPNEQRAIIDKRWYEKKITLWICRLQFKQRYVTWYIYISYKNTAYSLKKNNNNNKKYYNGYISHDWKHAKIQINPLSTKGFNLIKTIVKI